MNVEILGFPKKGEAWQEASRLIKAASGKGADCLDYLRKGMELGRRVSHEIGLSRIGNLKVAHRQQLEAINEARIEREVEHRLAIADERIKAARLAAFASGCNEAVVNFIVERTKAVRDGWARRWHPDDNGDVHYPSDADFAVEVGRWCDAYADMLEALPKVAAENGRKMSKADVEFLLAELLPNVAAAAKHGAARGAKQGAREGVIEYNDRVLLQGKTTDRKVGGGRKAQFDTDNMQCAALLALGKEYRDGKANPPASFSAYADIIIRRGYPAFDNPFVYRDTSDGRECGKVRTKLLKRFDTYLKHLPMPITRDEALPLAGATE